MNGESTSDRPRPLVVGDDPVRLKPSTEMLVDLGLQDWWMLDAERTGEQTLTKMAEYGSGDLVRLGQTLRRMAGRPPLDADRAMQLGCLIYLAGKIERAVEAVADDRDIKDDTWLDIEVYAKMARANRSGVWPVPSTLR